MAQYSVNNYTVENLLGFIKAGDIAIPEIQRPFVWDGSKVRDLLDSLYQGYPIGYIIVWQNPDVKLKDGTVSTGKKVLIDGQQRIMSLSAAIVGQEVTGEDYKKHRIIIAFNPQTEKFEVSNNALEKSPAWITDVADVFSPSFRRLSFLREYGSLNNLDDAQVDEIDAVITRLLSIQNNSLGVIVLDQNLDIEKVTDIFIRINSKGVVLSQADFVMSKISANEEYGGNITRKCIDYFCHLFQRPEDLGIIRDNDTQFSATPEYKALAWVAKETEDIYQTSYTDVLRVAFTSTFGRGRLADLVALLSGRNFTTREYQGEIAEESFKKLHDGVMDVINKTNFQRYIMILKPLGVVNGSLIRSQNVLNFGYILYLVLRRRGIEDSIIGKLVRRWVIITILTGRYSGSPESEFDYDVKLKTLLKNNIALWDTIKTCKREGSLDSDIQNETPNDIKSLLKKYPNIKTICLNGNKSYSAFKKYFPNLLEKYNCFKMPSTSPANARYSLDKLIEEWSIYVKEAINV